MRNHKGCAFSYANVAINIATIQTILHIIEMELIALESPTSPFKSSVYAGEDDGNGLNAKIINAIFTSAENGRR